MEQLLQAVAEEPGIREEVEVEMKDVRPVEGE